MYTLLQEIASYERGDLFVNAFLDSTNVVLLSKCASYPAHPTGSLIRGFFPAGSAAILLVLH